MATLVDLMEEQRIDAAMAETAAPAPETIKAYWRCPECLTVYVTLVPKPPKVRDRWAPLALESDRRHLLDHNPICGICDVPVEPMGVVTPKGATELTTTTTVCDWACQMAMGPLCDCKCLGANHGDRMARKIVVLEYRATQPVVTVEDPEAAKARALEFKAALAAALEALKARYTDIDGILAEKAAGRWVDAAKFDRLMAYRRAYKALEDAKTMKTHKARMKKLAGLVAG